MKGRRTGFGLKGDFWAGFPSHTPSFLAPQTCSLQYHFSHHFPSFTLPEIVYRASISSVCILHALIFWVLADIYNHLLLSSHYSPPILLYWTFTLLHLGYCGGALFPCPLILSLQGSPRCWTPIPALVFVFPTTSEWVYIKKPLCVSQAQG